MYFCLLNLMIMSFSMQTIAQTQSAYRYSRSKSNLLFNAVTCLDSGVFSLSHCAALAGGSKTVTFFYNEDENRCQWDCMFLYNENCTTLCTSPWTSYGKSLGFTLNIFLQTNQFLFSMSQTYFAKYNCIFLAPLVR